MKLPLLPLLRPLTLIPRFPFLRQGPTEREIVRLIFLAALSYPVLEYTGFIPRLRWSAPNLLLGLGFGIAIGIAVPLLRFGIGKTFRSLGRVSQTLFPLSTTKLLARAIVSGTTEELLLRGSIFGSLLFLRNTIAIAYGVNILLSALSGVFFGGVFFGGPRVVAVSALEKALQGTAYAVLYHFTGSLAALALARTLAELLAGPYPRGGILSRVPGLSVFSALSSGGDLREPV